MMNIFFLILYSFMVEKVGKFLQFHLKAYMSVFHWFALREVERTQSLTKGYSIPAILSQRFHFHLIQN